MKRTPVAIVALAIVVSALLAVAAEPPLQPKPVPPLQLVPQADDQIAIEHRGKELARYHFGADLPRPYVFPVRGPSGRVLTRMGHPHDPFGHSHHNSFWVTHHDVNGVSFWADRGTNVGRIVHQRVEALLDDGGELVNLISLNHWVAPNGRVLLQERRQTALQLLPNGEYLMILDLELTARGEPVTFGKTPFGIVGVRVAKSVGVRDGGGRIRNDTGGTNEKEIFWKPARWVDYSGATDDGVIEGLTLMDHPMNPQHPSPFHVREDGWMGASLSYNAPVVVAPEKPLRLRYGLLVHRDLPERAALTKRWEEFVATKLPEPPKKK